MNYSLFDLLQLIGALGVFIFGMKIFSEGLQKIAGNRLKSILSGMTRNRLTGVLTGFATTSITQSSTTTTVMAVSFVNAGLLTFVESTGVIMGANIGTTVTAWIVALFGFKMKITPIAMAMIGIFFAFLFSKNSRWRNIAETMVGFGILFIGLEFIKNGVPDIRSNPEMLAFLDGFAGHGYLSLLLFVFIGTALTLVMQSSSAATAVTLVMLFEGWISFPLAAAMVLGENIGTTVTANLAAMVGNVHAKRAARFHLIFNLIGVVWMMVAIYPVMHAIDMVILSFSDNPASIMSADPEARPNATLGLSLFHTSFNILNVILLFAFIPAIVRFIERILPAEEGDEDEYHLRYISTGVMNSPALSVEQAQKEVQQFAEIVTKMHKKVNKLLFDPKAKHQKLWSKIAQLEDTTDQLEIEISDYLVRVTEDGNLEQELTERIRFLQSMIHDLERIADIYFQISKLSERMQETKTQWPQEAVEDLVRMMNAVQEAIINMQENVARDASDINLDGALALENSIDELRDQFRNKHFDRLENAAYTPRAGVNFMDVLTRLERIGDHILNVNESAAGNRLKATRIAGNR